MSNARKNAMQKWVFNNIRKMMTFWSNESPLLSLNLPHKVWYPNVCTFSGFNVGMSRGQPTISWNNSLKLIKSPSSNNAKIWPFSIRCKISRNGINMIIKCSSFYYKLIFCTGSPTLALSRAQRVFNIILHEHFFFGYKSEKLVLDLFVFSRFFECNSFESHTDTCGEAHLQQPKKNAHTRLNCIRKG